MTLIRIPASAVSLTDPELLLQRTEHLAGESPLGLAAIYAALLLSGAAFAVLDFAHRLTAKLSLSKSSKTKTP